MESIWREKRFRSVGMKKEIELKYCFSTKDDFLLFKRFLERYRIDKKNVLMQENFYFDSPELDLRRNGISLRLRKQNHEFFLSAKQSTKKRSEKFLSVRLEYESCLDKRIAALICEENLSPIEAFAFLPASSPDENLTKKTLYRRMKKSIKTGLQIIGTFKNTRTTVPILLLGEQLVLELDHSLYPKNIEIYETEIEFSSVKEALSLRPAVESLFRAAGIRTHKSCSKSSRLFKILFGK